MARINIEECWWSDARRMALILKIGFQADAAAVNMWRTAQEFWQDGRKLIPRDVFDRLQFAADLIECGLADVRDRSIYVRGSSEWLEWAAAARIQRSEAGLKSAEARRKKNGTAQPKGGRQEKKIERESNENRTETNEIELSGSGSGFGSENQGETRAGARSAPPDMASPTAEDHALADLLAARGHFGKSRQAEARAFLTEDLWPVVVKAGGWKALCEAEDDRARWWLKDALKVWGWEGPWIPLGCPIDPPSQPADPPPAEPDPEPETELERELAAARARGATPSELLTLSQKLRAPPAPDPRAESDDKLRKFRQESAHLTGVPP